MTPSKLPEGGTEPVSDLLARRSQLQDWLRRLDEVDGSTPAQVARRVRADYQERLALVLADLAAHAEALAADRQTLEERLAAAAGRYDLAADALEEARLRHVIGELSAAEWDGRRPALEAEVEAAMNSHSETEAELQALGELLAQLSEVEAPAESDPEPAPQPQPHPVVDMSYISVYGGDTEATLNEDLVEIATFAAAAEAVADVVEPVRVDDDYAFLQELDRAIAATAPGSRADGDNGTETRPQPGLKCPECGYSNDASAWFCGVCKADLT